MFKNGLRYSAAISLLLLTHLSMLGIVLVRGKYEQPLDLVYLALAVLGFDLAGIIAAAIYRQMTYTLDLMLLAILNMSLIFQSCFGGVHLSIKHLITCAAAMVACELGFLLTRNHEWIRMQKKYIYIIIGILILAILTLTGGRSMWITFSSFSIQPSEFIKPCFILICAASIVELHKKIKILFFYVSKDTLYLCAMTVVIFGLQWWCRDLGSLPTFAAIFGCALVCRLCYPRARINKTAIASMCVGGVLLAMIAWLLAPSYVQDRLHADIWADPYGKGYQQCQALIGIARGGWLGMGPGQGNLHHVFAHESDIVFSTICEEWGLLYAGLTVVIILIMLTTVLMNPPKSYYHAMMAAGVVAAFTAQMALNIFGSCDLIPFTGVTLPFISEGGSSMVTCGFLVGMLKAGQSPLFHHEIKKRKPAQKNPKPQRRASA
ncbi:MAG: FtsW/RodA/SpoVE family cell cycle protein [Oscillospiraceae bacterium]|nr:FtsW/RodA/SpoVE family cell cycle protein [Oscillospiraceae bacterium]